jgi:MFS family permease
MMNTQQSNKPEPLLSRDFALACAGNFTFFGSMHFLLPALPLYIILLGGDESDVGMVMGAFTLTSVLLRPYVGRGVDNGRRKPFLLLGALIFTLASLCYNLASSVPLVLVVRAFHGVGIACFTTAAATYIADIVPVSRRGAALGYYGMFSNVAMSIGPFVGGLLMRAFGLPVLFAASAGMGLVSLGIMSLPREPAGAPSSLRAASTPRPLICRSAIFPSLVMFSVALTYGTVLSFLPLLAVARKIENFEVFFTAFALALMVVRAVAGELSDRFGRSAVVVPGLALTVAGMVLLSAADSLPALLLVALVYGLGFGAVSPALQAFTVDRAGVSDRGAAMATFSGAFDLGIGVGAVVLGYILQVSTFGVMYLAAAGCAVIGLAGFVLVSRRSPPPPSPTSRRGPQPR